MSSVGFCTHERILDVDSDLSRRDRDVAVRQDLEPQSGTHNRVSSIIGADCPTRQLPNLGNHPAWGKVVTTKSKDDATTISMVPLK